MIRRVFIAVTTLALIGCGGGNDTKTAAATTTNGKYNLWEYMTPSTTKTNTFTLTSNSVNTTYKSTYSVTPSRVTEVADYAKDETTIYEKGTDTITVRFEKNGMANGMYQLRLKANINDIVTKRDSTCKLSQHYTHFSIAGKNFDDVIEITCGTTPGYYQKGVGEIAQKEDKSGKNIRVLSN